MHFPLKSGTEDGGEHLDHQGSPILGVKAGSDDFAIPIDELGGVSTGDFLKENGDLPTRAQTLGKPSYVSKMVYRIPEREDGTSKQVLHSPLWGA